MNTSRSETDTIQCPHFSLCSGCVTDTPFSPKSPLYVRAKSFFLDITDGKVSPRYIHGAALKWRTRAKLACREVDGKVRFGLFQKGSHTLVHIPKCQVHHPSINQAVYLIEKYLDASRDIARSIAYNEITHRGLIRYIQCSVERKSGLVQLAVMINSRKDEKNTDLNRIESILIKMMQDHPHLFHSLWWNFNTHKTNTIYGQDWVHKYGPKYIWETITSVEIPILPSHFEQANLPLFEEALTNIHPHLSAQSRIIELYAGMGVISLALRNQVHSTVAIEENPDSYISFCEAKKRLPKDLQHSCDFHIGDSEEVYITQEKYPHILIVDPPRKGLSPKLAQTLSEERGELHIEKIIYISCHYLSLERDIEILMQKKQWKIVQADCYLFFPGTNHIETVVVLEKAL